MALFVSLDQSLLFISILLNIASKIELICSHKSKLTPSISFQGPLHSSKPLSLSPIAVSGPQSLCTFLGFALQYLPIMFSSLPTFH